MSAIGRAPRRRRWCAGRARQPPQPRPPHHRAAPTARLAAGWRPRPHWSPGTGRTCRRPRERGRPRPRPPRAGAGDAPVPCPSPASCSLPFATVPVSGVFDSPSRSSAADAAASSDRSTDASSERVASSPVVTPTAASRTIKSPSMVPARRRLVAARVARSRPGEPAPARWPLGRARCRAPTAPLSGRSRHPGLSGAGRPGAARPVCGADSGRRDRRHSNTRLVPRPMTASRICCRVMTCPAWRMK